MKLLAMTVNPGFSRSDNLYDLQQRQSRAEFDAWQSSAYCAPLIFVTGASRSVTIPVARMLGAHSEVKAVDSLDYIGELWVPSGSVREHSEQDLVDLAANLAARQSVGYWGQHEPSSVERSWATRLVEGLAPSERDPAGVYAAALKCFAEDRGRRMTCELAPQTIFYAREILAVYRNARVLHVVADPRSVLAAKKRLFSWSGAGSERLPFAHRIRSRINYHPITASKQWERATEQALRLTGHSRFKMLRYEDSVLEPKGFAQSLCRALGLGFEPEMIEVPRWGSSGAVREGGNSSPALSHEGAEWWRNSLTRGEVLLCEETVNVTMQRLGYKPQLLGRQGGFVRLPQWLYYPLHLAGSAALNPRRAWMQLRSQGRGSVER